MEKNLILVMVLVMFLGILPPVSRANEQVAADLFSNSVKALIPEISPEAGSVSKVSEPSSSSQTLSFLSNKSLKPADSQKKPLTKTAIHFLTGVDVDQIASPVTLEKQLTGVEIPVSVLVFEKCTNTGDASKGSSQCEWRYSSGFKSTLASSHTDDGKKRISHFTLTENDRGGSWQGKREVLHTTILEAGKVASEIYDITYDPGLAPGESAEQVSAKTREVLLYHYDPSAEGEKLKDMSWTKYADTREGTPREMEYHAVLTYDEDGRPKRGLASQWSSGWKANTLFDWHARKDAPDVSSRELWKMWEQWIKNGPSHVFIV